MFELTTSNLDQELREQKIADGLRRRQLLATNETQTAGVHGTATAATRTADTAPTARLGARRATVQR
jgi:hypothetical protein